MIKVSIIIAVYNRTDLLKKALLSLQYQSVKHDEIIISDDGSQENVIFEIEEIVNQFNCRMRYIRQEHTGFRLAKCRNNGARIAQGDYLIFLDQDLIFTQHFIKTFVKHQKKHYFCVSYPIRLTRKQTELLSDAMVSTYSFYSILEGRQRKKIKQQYFKDNFYALLKRVRLRGIGPKLRGGVAAIYKQDFIKVNGYDENYQGWGNEDDDLGRRMYQVGILGINPFYSQFPLHLYHEPFHEAGSRVNQIYYLERLKEIQTGNYRCEFGYDNPLGNDKITQIDLN